MEGIFGSRAEGDICLNCASDWDLLRVKAMALIIRVKPTSR